jgi:hypothetical protein
MSTMTYKLEEAWMMPNGDCMIFCSEEDGLALAALEIDISTGGPGTPWGVAAVRMVDSDKKRHLSGDLHEGAVAWIMATMRGDIETFIRENYSDPSEDYRDAIRSVMP